MNIILFGLPKSGKTTIGQKLAKDLSLSFVDTDRLIEKLYKQRFKVTYSCRKIYQTHGEKKFRVLESEAIFSLQDQSNAIISIGGGAIFTPKIFCFLQVLGELVYLHINKKTLYPRLLLDPPAFLSKLEDTSVFNAFYENRCKYMKKISAYTILVDDKTVEQIVDILSSFYRQISPRYYGQQ